MQLLLEIWPYLNRNEIKMHMKQVLERASPSNLCPPFDVKYLMSASFKWTPLFSEKKRSFDK